ncbi:MAG TPA: hypothetical protein VFV65_02525 [Gemmatimonadales bacterium]|nr:hypothetical protein [Gemmatimonadales bacterium]
MPDLPARIDRAALDRIIQRAAELQTGERELGDEMTEDQVLALGRDVGIPARYLQQALIEERVRTAPANARWLDRAVGRAAVSADRVVMGSADLQEHLLLEWMERTEHLMVQRQQSGRITWEQMGGIQAMLRMSAAALSGGARAMLDKAGVVSATITPLEAGYCHVQLTADLRANRGAFIGGGAALASVGLAATAVLAVLGAFPLVALLPFPAALAGGYAVTRAYASVAERTRLGLERALDQLERRATRPDKALPRDQPSMITSIVQEVRKALKP